MISKYHDEAVRDDTWWANPTVWYWQIATEAGLPRPFDFLRRLCIITRLSIGQSISGVFLLRRKSKIVGSFCINILMNIGVNWQATRCCWECLQTAIQFYCQNCRAVYTGPILIVPWSKRPPGGNPVTNSPITKNSLHCPVFFLCITHHGYTVYDERNWAYFWGIYLGICNILQATTTPLDPIFKQQKW